MQSQLQEQNQQLIQLATQLQCTQEEMTKLQNPTYSQLYTYIDTQVEHVYQDVDRLLKVKADKHEVDTVLPLRVEELYRQLLSKYQDMKCEVIKCVSKEEFLQTMQNKVCLFLILVNCFCVENDCLFLLLLLLFIVVVSGWYIGGND